jgi:hypothetical protein
MDWDVIAMILHQTDFEQPVALRSRRLPLKISLAEPDLALLSLSGSNGGRSSMVEPRIVVPDVAGSNPVGHPSPDLLFLGKIPSNIRQNTRKTAIAGVNGRKRF